MPGVPSGRGCEGCRKAKRKCDEIKPACSRCARLHLSCIGSGKKRYKFVSHGKISIAGNRRQIAEVSQDLKEWDASAEIVRNPSNELGRLLNGLIRTISPSTDFRYNILLTYGLYFEDIPRRLGTNEALDASVEVLISAHSDMCQSRQEVAHHTLSRYSHALRALRLCLDDQIKACSAETLCAVSLLSICQAFIGNTGPGCTSHSGGAAQILKIRGLYNPEDEFEVKLLLSLRGPVLFEALLNSNIQFTPSEWKTLVENGLDGVTYEGQMMQCLGQVHDLIRRGRIALRNESGHQAVAEGIRVRYQTMKVISESLHSKLLELEDSLGDTRASVNGESTWASVLPFHAFTQRAYGLALTITIMLNCMLSAFDTNDSLALESTYFSTEILALAEQAMQYRPLGASYMVVCLVAAFVGTADAATRSLIMTVLAEYQSDFFRVHTSLTVADLDQLSRQLRFRF